MAGEEEASVPLRCALKLDSGQMVDCHLLRILLFDMSDIVHN